MVENKKYSDSLTKAMKLCAAREYCSSEIENKLEKWGVAAADRERILRTLIKDKFIDNYRYSVAFANDKFRQNRWGKIKIAVMLKSKGIDEKTIQQAVGSINEKEYLDTLRKLLATHRKSVRAKSSYEFKGKLARFALSRGFEPELVYQILEEDD